VYVNAYIINVIEILKKKRLNKTSKYTVKKAIDFPVPSRDVTDQTLLRLLAGNNLIIPGQGEFGR
jgi:hypothetical protein